MRVPGPRLLLRLLLLLPPRCWLRLRSAVSENSTLVVKWYMDGRIFVLFMSGYV